MFVDQVKVEKKKTSVKAEVQQQATQAGTGKQQPATRAHPLMSSAGMGAMPQRWEHLHVHQIKSVMFYRVTRDAVNRESPRFRETRASPKHNRGILEIAT